MSKEAEGKRISENQFEQLTTEDKIRECIRWEARFGEETPEYIAEFPGTLKESNDLSSKAIELLKAWAIIKAFDAGEAPF